jgi:hypothetical protein
MGAAADAGRDRAVRRHQRADALPSWPRTVPHSTSGPSNRGAPAFNNGLLDAVISPLARAIVASIGPTELYHFVAFHKFPGTSAGVKRKGGQLPRPSFRYHPCPGDSSRALRVPRCEFAALFGDPTTFRCELRPSGGSEGSGRLGPVQRKSWIRRSGGGAGPCGGKGYCAADCAVAGFRVCERACPAIRGYRRMSS